MSAADPEVRERARTLLAASLATSGSLCLDPLIERIAGMWSVVIPYAAAVEAARNLVAHLALEDFPAAVAAISVLENRMRSGRIRQLSEDELRCMALAAANAWARSQAGAP